MKTYVVNMEKDTQKRALIEKQLQQHPELDWQIWKAVEGRKLSEEEQKGMILPQFYERYGRNATLPAAGCSLSHHGIYQNMIATDTKYALILEDDAILSSDLKLDSVTKLLDTNEPTAILMTSEFWYHKDSEMLTVDSKHNIYRLNDGYMTSGYAINLAAARLIAPKVFPVQYTADAWKIFIIWGLKLYGIVPHVISYPDGLGEIGKSQFIQQTPFDKIRAIAVYIYIRILWIRSFLRGNRKSLKKWK